MSSPRRKPKTSRVSKGMTKNKVGMFLLALGIMIGIPIGILLQPYLYSILTPPSAEKKEASITILVSNNCILKINDTTDPGGFGLRSMSFFDYAEENITGSTLAMGYGIYLNESIIPVIKHLADTEDNLNDIGEELRDSDFEEEDADLFTTIYPRAMTNTGLGVNCMNIMVEDFMFPYINFSATPYPEGYFPEESLIENDIELNKDHSLILVQILIVLNVSYSYTDEFGVETETYDFIMIIAPFFFDIPLEVLYGFEEDPLEGISIRSKALVETGEDLEVEITEFYWNVWEDELHPYSMTVEVNGREEVILTAYQL